MNKILDHQFLSIGLIPFLWNTFDYISAVRGQPSHSCRSGTVSVSQRKKGSNICTKKKFRDFSVQKCFSELKISNSRISCTLNLVRRSFWKAVWVTKSGYTSETSVNWRIFCFCSWQVTDPCYQENLISTLSLETFYHLLKFPGFVNTLELFHSINCSAPASWIQGPCFSVCFKSVASFCHPQYLSRASHLSIHCAWNSRISHFYLIKTFLPGRNLWNVVFATLRPDRGNWQQQFVYL